VARLAAVDRAGGTIAVSAAVKTARNASRAVPLRRLRDLPPHLPVMTLVWGSKENPRLIFRRRSNQHPSRNDTSVPPRVSRHPPRWPALRVRGLTPPPIGGEAGQGAASERAVPKRAKTGSFRGSGAVAVGVDRVEANVRLRERRRLPRQFPAATGMIPPVLKPILPMMSPCRLPKKPAKSPRVLGVATGRLPDRMAAIGDAVTKRARAVEHPNSPKIASKPTPKSPKMRSCSAEVKSLKVATTIATNRESRLSVTKMSRPGKRPSRTFSIPARYRLRVVPVLVPVRRARRHRLINRDRRGTWAIASIVAE